MMPDNLINFHLNKYLYKYKAISNRQPYCQLIHQPYFRIYCKALPFPSLLIIYKFINFLISFSAPSSESLNISLTSRLLTLPFWFINSIILICLSVKTICLSFASLNLLLLSFTILSLTASILIFTPSTKYFNQLFVRRE